MIKTQNEKSPFDKVLESYSKNSKELSKFKSRSKHLKPYKKGRRIDLDESQLFLIRPIAETLAMLDGNAFFGNGSSDPEDAYGEWWMQYAADAIVLWEANGGKNGWAGLSLLGDLINHENDQVREAFENWLILKKLSRGENNEQ
jgi:hypothetical protein